MKRITIFYNGLAIISVTVKEIKHIVSSESGEITQTLLEYENGDITVLNKDYLAIIIKS